MSNDFNVERWRFKQMIKKLQSLKGNGTSVITLTIPGGSQMSQYSAMMVEEQRTASNIKSSVNRNAVLGCIASILQKMRGYPRVPQNGLVIYAGTVLTEENKEKKLTMDIVPFRPVSRCIYACHNKFDLSVLEEQLEDDAKYAFIIVDGNGVLFAQVCGNRKQILHKFQVDLPKKQKKGGQSAVRFSRLRMEARHNYVRKVCETANNLYMKGDLPAVKHIILAGVADFKRDVATSDILDKRLTSIILPLVDVAYGGENGLNEALDKVKDDLANIGLLQEKKVLDKFFEHIATDTKRFVYGLKETFDCLRRGEIKTLIVNESSEFQYVEIDGEPQLRGKVSASGPEPEGEQAGHRDAELFTDWISVNYQKFGCDLEFVSDATKEGTQFLRGFGGIGGILHYAVSVDFIDPTRDQEDDEIRAECTMDESDFM